MRKHRLTVSIRTDSEAQDGHWMKMQRLQRKQSMMHGESLKQKLGEMADQVVEVVYGIPIWHKGGKTGEEDNRHL